MFGASESYKDKAYRPNPLDRIATPNRRCSLFAIFKWLVGIILCTYVLYFFMSGDKNNQEMSGPVVQRAKTKSSVPNSAYVFLALGVQAHQLNCPAAIESLVKFAGWDGDVYLITDKEQCFDRKKIVRMSGIQPEKLHISKADGDFSKGGIDLSNPHLMLRGDRMMSKAMKTKVFNFVDPNIELLAFADCDMIFGIEGCATDIMKAGNPWGPDVKLKLGKVYRNPETNKLIGLHTGFFVAHRKYTAETLQRWGESLDSHEHDMDYKAYLGAYEKAEQDYARLYHVQSNASATEVYGASDPAVGRPSGSFRNPLDPDEVLCDYCPLPEKRYELFLNLAKAPEDQVTCINHISKARCKDYGRQGVQGFVNRFQLEAYKDDLFCVHPVVEQSMYGWFPWSSVPGCPKFERIL